MKTGRSAGPLESEHQDRHLAPAVARLVGAVGLVLLVGLACDAQNLGYFWVTTGDEEVTVSGSGRTVLTYAVRVTNAQHADGWHLDFFAMVAMPEDDTGAEGWFCAPDLTDPQFDCYEVAPGEPAEVPVTLRCDADGTCNQDDDGFPTWGHMECSRELCEDLASFAVDYETTVPTSLSYEYEEPRRALSGARRATERSVPGQPSSGRRRFRGLPHGTSRRRGLVARAHRTRINGPANRNLIDVALHAAFAAAPSSP